MSEKCNICGYSFYTTCCDLCNISCCILCFVYHHKSCNDFKKFNYHMCDVHSRQQVMRYCFDCDILLCKKCLEEGHRQHTCVLLMDAFHNFKPNTEAILNDLHLEDERLFEVIRVIDITATDRTVNEPLDVGRNPILEMKQTMTMRIETLLECLQNAKLQLTFLFEKDIFVIVFLRILLKVKQLIKDYKNKETVFKLEVKQFSKVMDDNLQKALQLFLSSPCDGEESTVTPNPCLTASIADEKPKEHTDSAGLKYKTDELHKNVCTSDTVVNEKRAHRIEQTQKTTIETRTRDSFSFPLMSKNENTITDISHPNASAGDREKTTQSEKQRMVSENSTKTNNSTEFFKQDDEQFSLASKPDDISDVIQRLSDMKIETSSSEKHTTIQTKSGVVRDLVQREGQMQTCGNNLCQMTMDHCNNMAKTIEHLKSQLDNALKEFKTQKADKTYMKEISEVMLTWLQEISDTNGFKGQRTINVDNDDSDVKSFLENMKTIYQMFEQSETALKTTNLNLDKKTAYYTNWTDSQRNADIVANEKYKAELKNKQDVIETMTDSISKMQCELDDLKSHNYILREDNDNLKKRHQEMVQCMQQKITSPEILTMQNNIQQQSQQIERLKWQTSEKEKTIQNLEKEKNDLQLRLSSMAGDQLTKKNPAITDLSDPKRPMKVGEQFKDIYDNEWTDAMECLKTEKSLFSELKPSELEESIIRHLYQTVKICYQECLAISESQVQTFASTIGVEEGIDLCTFPCFTEMLKFRRDTADQYADKLKKKLIGRIDLKNWEYPSKNHAVVNLLAKTPFFDMCVTQCWYMVIQEPLIYLDEELTAGTKYDKTQYKEFTSSGDKVRFVVWPALYLHKDGPLLCKGVVQAYN